MANWQFNAKSKERKKLKRFIHRDLESVLGIKSIPKTILVAEFGVHWGSVRKRQIDVYPLEGKILKIDINIPKDYAYRGLSVENINPKGLVVYYNTNKYKVTYEKPKKED